MKRVWMRLIRKVKIWFDLSVCPITYQACLRNRTAYGESRCCSRLPLLKALYAMFTLRRSRMASYSVSLCGLYFINLADLLMRHFNLGSNLVQDVVCPFG